MAVGVDPIGGSRERGGGGVGKEGGWGGVGVGGGRYEKKRGEKNGDKEEVTGEWRYHFYLILH